MSKTDIFTKNNKFLMLALDHRGNLVKTFKQYLKKDNVAEEVVHFKRYIIESISEGSSGLLLDPIYGLPAYHVAVKNKPALKNKSFLLCLEKSGYVEQGVNRITNLGYGVKELKQLGAQGIKLLLFFHPKSKMAQYQLDVAMKAFNECQKEELPFFLEILTYPIAYQETDNKNLILESVKIMLDHGIKADVFKLEFPGNAAACRKITKTLDGIPWILLTKGENFDKFKNGLKTAIKNGASGFLAGRSLWQDFIDLPPANWQTFFATIVNKRFRQINQIATG